MAVTKVVLILGAGPNIGKAVAAAFTAKGYKTALAARSLKPEESTAEQLNIQADFSDPSSIAGVFATVEKKFGAPSVVIYNAAGLNIVSETDPLAGTISGFAASININTVSAYAALQASVAGFSKLPNSAPRTFLYTGNALNRVVVPSYLDLGVGKSATAYIIEASTIAYKNKGYKFCYVDERKPDGQTVYPTDGPGHAVEFIKLAEASEQGPWDHTFVQGEGFKKF
ncbi:hypothetical protein OIDMADRAFT_146478 [Oidiodendron maius Zn]|uniref:Short-chain dehydrogenase n=1 Tax=Oidiodendron maius (strain Zn) TaxID=913774 RepID=A0A0C3H9X5_OIDMZ|nr:hypothetical protein OIDMADRAFT_146478 [Oidiodendron maius Zn]